MKEIYRLVYTSVRKPNCTEKEIEKILDSCQRNNSRREVTGILIHSDKRFLQYIEGEKEELQRLYDLIKLDDRHAGLNQRNFEPIGQRTFPSWQMAYKDVSVDAVDYKTNISEEDKKVFDGLIHDEVDFSDKGLKVLQLFFKMN